MAPAAPKMARPAWITAILLSALGAVSLPGAVRAQSASAQASPALTCQHAEKPTDAYIGWVDLQAGAFHFRCRLFDRRSSIPFEMRYRSPQLPDSPRASLIGGGWGTDFDDFVEDVTSNRITIRGGADGSVESYAASRPGKPMLVTGQTAGQRARRKMACEFFEAGRQAWLRREYCDRSSQDFDRSGRLVSYTSHAFRQIFNLDWQADRLAAVTSYAPDGHPVRIAFARSAHSRTVTDQDGRTVIFDFGDEGRLLRVAGSTGEAYGFAYAADGTLMSITFPSGESQTMAYDAKGRIMAIKARHGGGARFTYRRSATEVIEQAPDGSESRRLVTFG